MQDSDNQQDVPVLSNDELGTLNQNIVDIEKLAPALLPEAKIDSKSDVTIEEGKRLNLKEATRSKLGIGLLVIYGLTVASALGITYSNKIKEEERKEIIVLIMTSQATLVGIALGFYFGKEK